MLPWQRHFDRSVYLNLLMKINFNAIILNFLGFLQYYIVFQYFSVVFGEFLKILKNFEIQDGRSKMEAVWISWRNCHVI